MPAYTFGERIKELRLQHDITLRQFCAAIDHDPSNWSKIERGILAPPREEDFYVKIASILHLEATGPELTELRDLAARETGTIPADLANDPEVLEILPLFFRTIRNDRPTPDELAKAIELIRSSFGK